MFDTKTLDRMYAIKAIRREINPKRESHNQPASETGTTSDAARYALLNGENI
jgi:hypothetical protein